MSGDTAVALAFGPPFVPQGPNAGAHIFQRDRGGVNAWGEVTSFGAFLVGQVSISGDLLAGVWARAGPAGPAAGPGRHFPVCAQSGRPGRLGRRAQ